MAVGTAVAGPIMQAAANKAEADLKAKEEERKVDILREQSQRELQIARADAQAFRRKNSRALARSRALRSASGVLSAGSPLLVNLDNAAELELGVRNILNAGDVRFNELRQQIEFIQSNIVALENAGVLLGGRAAVSSVSGARAANRSQAPASGPAATDTKTTNSKSGSSDT